MSNTKPWHDAPPCRDCGATVATPARHSGRHGTDAPPDLLYCPACGCDWTESDLGRVAQAWWSHGAYVGGVVREAGEQQSFEARRDLEEFSDP